MPGLFESGSVPETPGPTFGVGAQGSSYLSMKPRLLLQMLQMRHQQAAKQQADSLEAMKRLQSEVARRQVMSQLTPQEQLDAQMFGMDYVQSQRAKKEQRGYEEAKSAEAERKKTLADAAKAEAIKAQARGKVQGVMDTVNAGRVRSMVPGTEGFRAPGQEEIAGMQTTGTPQDILRMTQQQAGAMAAPQQRYRIIDPAEKEILLKAGAQIPEGWIEQGEFAAQRKDQQKQQAEAEKAAQEAARREAQKKVVSMYLPSDVTPDEAAQFTAATEGKDKPDYYGAAKQIRENRKKTQKEADTAKDKVSSFVEVERKKMEEAKSAWEAYSENPPQKKPDKRGADGKMHPDNAGEEKWKIEEAKARKKHEHHVNEYLRALKRKEEGGHKLSPDEEAFIKDISYESVPETMGEETRLAVRGQASTDPSGYDGWLQARKGTA